MSIGEVFADAQRSNVGHKTLAKRLRRLENNTNGFEAQIKQCIFRLLDVSKSEIAGNRVIRFLTIYLQDADASSPTTSSVLLSLLPFLCARDRTVRYRATQLVSQILAVLSAVDDDLYKVIRHELIKRLHDKVPAIRLEAAAALGRIVENELDEEPDEQGSDEDVAPSLLEKLLDVLQNDGNAEVRRKLLLNLPITPTTLPYLLERARDKDAPTRRALYSRLLPKLGDFRHLSLSMREKLLRWGFRDRDEAVRKAAARLFSERWIEDCAASQSIEENPDKTVVHEASVAALLELLERIDIINTGAETGIGTDAMKEFWLSRPDYVDIVSFEDDFWDNLSTESSFMARTFLTFCQFTSENRVKYQDIIPEVTRIGFYIQKYLNILLDSIRIAQDLNPPEHTEVPSEESLAEQEFIVEQLLHIAHQLDYTDEIGRRKMFTLLRNAIAVAELPEEITRLAIEALRLVCNPDLAGEKEFTSVVLEAIAEVHDTITAAAAEAPDEEDSFVSAHSQQSDSSNTPTTKRSKKSNLSPEEQEAQALREIMVNLKCLSIATSLLQLCTSSLTSNPLLESMLNNLVIPAVRSHETPIREKGVLCLGLCCMLEPKLADENIPVFTHCLKKGNGQLQVMATQILCDIYLSRGPTARASDAASEQSTIDLTPFLIAMELDEEVACIAVESVSKLMLCGFYKSNGEIFDEAVDKAAEQLCKGWELVAKVRAAVKTGAEVDKSGEVDEERRKSGDQI